jgi:hypothetical protein
MTEGRDPRRSYRETLVESHHTASQDFDKAIMTLAGGGLGLSIAFIHEVAPHPEHLWAVGIAWGLLTASLLLIVFSFLTSQGAILARIAEIDKRPTTRTQSSFGRLTLWLNIFSAGAFVIAVAFLVLFALYNI